MDEAQIIRQCQNGDWSNFHELYACYIDRIYRFMYHRVSHKETAEDLTSAVFVKLVDNIGKYKEDNGYFPAWLFTIARNLLIDHYRVHKATIGLEEIPDIPTQNNVENELDKTIDLGEIRSKLPILPQLQREILTLRVWDELSHKEIGEILNISEANSKVAFSRAIVRLKKEISLVSLIILLLI